MKPIRIRKESIFYRRSRLVLEIEEYKTLYVVHFIDPWKYFGLLHTIRFKKYKSLKLSDIVTHCREYAIVKDYFI